MWSPTYYYTATTGSGGGWWWDRGGREGGRDREKRRKEKEGHPLLSLDMVIKDPPSPLPLRLLVPGNNNAPSLPPPPLPPTPEHTSGTG